MTFLVDARQQGLPRRCEGLAALTLKPCGQRFVIDLDLTADLSESSRTDRLSDTVSYSDVVACASAAFRDTNYKLLERAAGAVADAVLTAFPRVSTIKVTVHKPHAPIAAIFDDVGIILTRGR